MKVLRMADQDLAGKRVLIRADMNVPLGDHGAITDDTRIRASLGGIRAALEKGAAVMVTSHLGRPTEGQFSEADSLAPVARRLSELLGFLLPRYRTEGKSYLTIAIGCTGGKHRSVALSTALAERLETGGQPVRLWHRDVDKE